MTHRTTTLILAIMCTVILVCTSVLTWSDPAWILWPIVAGLGTGWLWRHWWQVRPDAA